jgi:phosphoesterase RecJ-like protein
MNKNNSLDEIAKAINSAKKVAVFSHYNPDTDAYGSSCGMFLTLKHLGKPVCCVNESGILQRDAFLPGVSEVQAKIPDGDWDTAIVCDCGDQNRVGDSLKSQLSRFATVINVDHHASNPHFGTLNYVFPKASSTAEIIFEVLQHMKVKLLPEVATCLLAGIYGDTGSFRYSNTSARVLEVARELVLAGAKPAEISNELYGRVSLQALKLEAAALAGLNIHFGGKLSEVVIPEQMYKSLGATSDDTDPIVDRIRAIEGVKIAVLIRQVGDLWKISMRSSDDRADLSLVAAQFGGGGHKAAAAFRWRKGIDELRPLLLKALESEVAKLS